MTRRELFRASVAASAFTGAASADQNQTTAITIAITNQSGVAVTQDMVDALQIQLDSHFGPLWGRTAALKLQADTSPTRPGDVSCLVQDYSDASGALGYHYCQNDGTPYLRIFAQTAAAYGQSVSSILSHELLEMLANPSANAFLLNDSGRGTGYLYNLEICDPVQQSFYTINGFTVSNFVTPRFYLSSAPGPYDYMSVVTAPFTPAPGGRLPMTVVGGLPSLFS